MENVLAYAVPGFLLLIVVELFASRLLHRPVYRFNDSMTDLSCGLLDQTLAALLAGLLALPYLFIYQHMRLLELEANSLFTFLIAFVLKDIGYYAFHRFSHRTQLGWASHAVHHQSEEYNLAVALRQPAFAGVYGWVFYLPMAFLGIPFATYVLVSSLNLLYQFWIHTRLIDRLGPLEWVLNTPSHHRVHHGCDPKYLDKNYAGVFILWDRLFGTFVKEEEEPRYGTSHPLRSWNPVHANLTLYADLFRQSRFAPTLWVALKLWFMPPGWTPAHGEPGRLEPGPGRGYDADVSTRKRRLGIGILFLPAIPAVMLLMAAPAHPWSLEQSLGYGALALFVALSALVCGGLLEGKRWAWPLEGGRWLVAVGVLVSGLPNL